VKSLGAWGGDFGMFVSEHPVTEIKEWCWMEGFPDIFTFDELQIPT
jgi:hypothetical protein